MSQSSEPSPREPLPRQPRSLIARCFTIAEDIVYIGLGILLAAASLTLLVTGAISFVENIGALHTNIVWLLDRILLILLSVELLYTVQVSFREHALLPQPFLLVGLISAIRRVLVLTAEFGEWRDKTDTQFNHFVIELGVLTVLVLGLAISIVLLQRNSPDVAAHRA